MAKQILRFRCTSVAEVEQVKFAEGSDDAITTIVRKIRLVEVGPADEIGDAYSYFELGPLREEDAKGYEVGKEYFVSIAAIPKPRAPRR